MRLVNIVGVDKLKTGTKVVQNLETSRAQVGQIMNIAKSWTNSG